MRVGNTGLAYFSRRKNCSWMWDSINTYGSVSVDISLLVGRALEAILSTRVSRVSGKQLDFSFSPGNLINFMEHVLIYVFIHVGMMRPNKVCTVATAERYFHKDVYWSVAYMATFFVLCEYMLLTSLQHLYSVFPHHFYCRIVL